MQPNQPAACSAVPKDCVVVFLMPTPEELNGHSAAGLISGVVYRTEPQSFAEASKRAAHYAQITLCGVEKATAYVLDSVPAVPIPKSFADLIYRRRAPRFRHVDAMRDPAVLPGFHPWRN